MEIPIFAHEEYLACPCGEVADLRICFDGGDSFLNADKNSQLISKNCCYIEASWEKLSWESAPPYIAGKPIYIL